jgi:hypothetical protein
MEIFVYERLIQQRSKIGKYASIAGLAILALGLVVSIAYPQYVYLSFITLIAGFILSQIGNYNLMRWGRKPRPDTVLDDALKGMERKWRIYHYYLPAAHVLIGPGGLYVFALKTQGGKISAQGARWKQKLGLGRALFFFGEESLGNPAADLDIEMRKLARFINDKRPDLSNVTLRGAVIFTNPRVELDVTEPTIKVLLPKNVKAYVRATAGPSEKYLSAEQRRALLELFDQEVQRING